MTSSAAAWSLNGTHEGLRQTMTMTMIVAEADADAVTAGTEIQKGKIWWWIWLGVRWKVPMQVCIGAADDESVSCAYACTCTCADQVAESESGDWSSKSALLGNKSIARNGNRNRNRNVGLRRWNVVCRQRRQWHRSVGIWRSHVCHACWSGISDDGRAMMKGWSTDTLCWTRRCRCAAWTSLFCSSIVGSVDQF
ncbi:uncharacterized protein HMPREF1120_08242 [Exophiala dermatitidis NIH/UT8656]|uniref:Uncharacterized protein n=1 Tax=Exophiala dermatitidis (strain ATCC 34100 / CBS 525.76 / NIH/UT8656) TaxID=858893 RepID=H6C847_EXODN|nr:uncharacterized protein HMPREF1120_08242 [Exophiala dermatitidis NIH/UT8656]EHY60274.1 hypothetical protein HMPREF1120_08242 [Exophiala dermatitidis NIH/UT8656]